MVDVALVFVDKAVVAFAVVDDKVMFSNGVVEKSKILVVEFSWSDLVDVRVVVSIGGGAVAVVVLFD